ncbi:NADPH-dependent diflavin oxidoreductase 1-like [Pyrus ussuriensis x Pyrus communis]|uniref:NADPH-dependent diflavin oxidoreductase 1-like n=1 Tax=Pyrus ussuriensis x Pyrus communis TaxID=2448454 RepID=A0A5N5HTD3_9ROSA|nr:NADPH-dependent diflavin oxidoreductase 1-like [Pyrus ussuriensis x Pyrus communis]
MEETPKKLLILYATQTGNAVEAAERVGREAERRGCCPVHLLSMDQYDAGCLAQEKEGGSRTVVIFVVSTTGQGVTPDTMKGFWNFLLRRSLSGQWLQGLHYAVFGLGDSGYQKFNYVAKRLDRRLLQLGATPIVERGLGDEQHPSGYEAVLDPWMTSLWNMLNEIHPNYYFPNGPEFSIPDDKVKEARPKIRILYHEIDKLDSQFSATSDLNHQAALLHIERARKMSPGKFSSHDENKPDCFLKLVKNEPLTKSSGSKDDKEVHHLEFEFVSPAIEYDVGDLLEVVPCQNPAAIDDFILRCNVDPESFITVMRMFATDEHEKGILEHLVSPEGRSVLHKYIHKERMTVNDVLKKFPSVQIPFEWLVQVVPPLKPRAFSISSSPSAHPNQVHLTVTVASWRSPLGRNRAGLCSNWLAKLDAKQEVYVPVWFRKGSLPPPLPSLPLILIGPGTGCAPFRGFVEERAIQSLNSTRTAPVMFFLGCRNKDKDFLYKDFWLSHSENGGILSEAKGGGFYVAFSRDEQSHNKVYVQHRMREHSKRVYDLLRHGGAAIYVAGSATKMPADVLSTFEEIIAKESGLPQESAARCLKDIQAAGKYHVEAWS